MIRPFLIFAVPRSRTAWLSAFLTYRDWICYHEQAFNMRSMAEGAAVLAQPNTGSAETATSPAWELIKKHVPHLRAVVIRRPIEETIHSMAAAAEKALGVPVYGEKLRKGMEYGNRCLEKISAHPGTLTLQFRDLETEAGCRAVFEFCLPYQWDRDWWFAMKDTKIEADVAAKLRYYWDNREAIEGFKRALKIELIQMRRKGVLSHAVI